MAGIKRKSAAPVSTDSKGKSKKAKLDQSSSKRSAKEEVAIRAKPSKKTKVAEESEELNETDTTEDEIGFNGFSAKSSDIASSSEAGDSDGDSEAEQLTAPERKSHKNRTQDEARSKPNKKSDVSQIQSNGDKSTLDALNATSSREAHAKQKALKQERKAAKPNADIIERSKKLWEKLRLKSHVEKSERKELVKELFEIVTGRVKLLVFQHDSVRVIQCAIKYSTIEQRRMIARELKGEFKTLAEGKYSKFLIAKLLEKGDPEIRDLIISEFYGHVRRLINHPEAAWILDDTYRAVATPEQKSRLLREWYGPEFSIKGLDTQGTSSAEISTILKESPEKRKPIMDYLSSQINSTIQKKQTGFTMLHDAMLQYFLACTPGSEETNNFLEHLRPDTTLKEGEEADNVDILKNLAFTKSGSRLVALALAYGSAKDRKVFLRPYKDTIEMMAYDANAHHVLLAALAVVDDTKLTSKSIFGELLPSNDTVAEKVLNLASDPKARAVLLYPFAPDAKWLLDDASRARLSEVYSIRSTTSKKDANARLHELAKSIESQLLAAITARAADFASFGFGLQFMSEVLLGAPKVEAEKRREALVEVATHAKQILESSLATPAESGKKQEPSALGKNMLKTLVQGGKFDPKLKKVVPVEPPLGFADLFWDQIKDDVVQWATGQGSWVIVSLTEAEEFGRKDEVLKALKKHRSKLEAIAGAGAGAKDKSKNKKKGEKEKGSDDRGNAGARILLEKL